MRSIWSGSISFGLINIPVKMYSGSQSHTLNLDMLRKGDLCPIRFARVCRDDGQEIPYKEIVKGYEYKEGDYVVLTDKDFEAASVEKTNAIEIVHFVKESDIDNVLYEKPYFLNPTKAGAKAFVLLKEALDKTKKVGIAKFVIHNREHIAAVKPYKNIIVLNQLRYQDEIRDTEELEIPSVKNIRESEVNIAASLIDQLTYKFKPKEYKDTYRDDLMKIIEEKAKGHHTKAKGKKPKPTNVRNLMTLLKQSLKEQDGRHRKKHAA